MKRIAHLLEELDETELVDLSKMVGERVNRLTSYWSEKFFLKCPEVFLNEILERVARVLSFDQVRQLGLVSKYWNESIHQVGHLNFYINHWSDSIYSVFLGRQFTKVDSIKSHAKILADSSKDNYGGFARIKYLEISEPGKYEKIPYPMDLFCWLSLETLILPQENFDYKIRGLGRLTTLTSLKCDSSVFVKKGELFELKNLTSLCITSLSIYAEPAASFPLLTYLESDFIGHFTGFTGKGILEGDDRRDVDDGEDRDFLNEKNDLFQKGAWSICLYGDWECGLFTGEANIQYNNSEDGEMIMHGQMVKGKYDGPGIEEIRIDSKEIYRGGFKHGLKDGLVTLYKWEGMYYPGEKLIPHSLQYWSMGEKLDEFFFSFSTQTRVSERVHVGERNDIK